MALVLADRVLETCSAPGTGTVSLLGAVASYQTFAAAIGNANTTYYAIADQSGSNWEVGIGTVATGSPNTLARTTILASSNGGSLVNFNSGTQNVFVTYPAEKSVNLNASGNVSALGTISSGTWNASTIATTYGGTGLTSFTAGDLPYYASGTALSKLGIGTSGQVLTSSGTAPQWATLSGVAVTTFSAGTTGFTPNTSTSGAITLAGTLNVANGGTGVTASSGANSVVLRDANQNITVNNVLDGYNTITAAAGTTVLTVSSAHWQKVTGSTTQTIQLPDATTLALGTSFIVDNDSTGTVTINDAASGLVDSMPSGTIDYLFLESNGTSAGVWGKYSWLPSTYNFNTTSADFGAATISNATWNGTAVTTAYGGTGLTSYTAGDLPYYASGTTLSKLGIGTSGQILTSNGTAPQWSTLSSSAVTTISFGTTGLTPSTATSGAVTVAGTLAIANGGTNQTAFTAKSGNVAGLTFFDGTSLSNDSSVTDVGYDTSTHTLQGRNFQVNNGIVCNNMTVGTSYTIPSGYSGSSVGPITVASGQTVTVSSGSRWVVL